jgi:endonuclease/exonuclease/phosphatase (EEP) superfamily protein YafD
MKTVFRSRWILLSLVFANVAMADERPADEAIRILSWNISNDAFVAEQQKFQSLIRWADPDVLLLDEVTPFASNLAYPEADRRYILEHMSAEERSHPGLIAAELYHADGASTWTWDGRGMPFPSNTLDFQLYSPHSLEMRSSFILDPEFLAPEVLELHGLERNTAKRTGRHRPLLVEYGWH